MKTTITEVLAELATIDKRLPKKAQELIPYVARAAQLKDPLSKSGGSERYIAAERQSFSDLLQRKIILRRVVAKANAETTIAIDGKEMSVADWLVWKRECYAPHLQMLQGLLGQAQGARQQAQQRGVALIRVEHEQVASQDILVCLDERELIDEVAALEERFGRLDGLLSLKNATTSVEV